MKNPKCCPVLLHAIYTTGKTENAVERSRCLGGQCQWYAPFDDDCSIAVMSHIKVIKKGD